MTSSPPPFVSLSEVRESIRHQLAAHDLPPEGPAAAVARNIASGLYLELEHARREASRFAAALRVIRAGCTSPEGVAVDVLAGGSIGRTILAAEEPRR